MRAYVLPHTLMKVLQFIDPNEENILMDKEIHPDDSIVQKLNPANNNYNIKLPDDTYNGLLFWIINSSDTVGHLTIIDQSNNQLLNIGAGQVAQCICINNTWTSFKIGDNSSSNGIVSLQYLNPNRQNLTGSKYLTQNDSTIQQLNPAGNEYHVVLPDPVTCTGMVFNILNSSTSDGRLLIYDHSDSNLVAIIESGNMSNIFCIADNWYAYSDDRKKIENISRTINIDNSMSSDEIQYKIDNIGKHILHGVEIIIQFADGVYNLTKQININGFYGGGELHIVGNLGEVDLSTNKSVVFDGQLIPYINGWNNIIRCDTNSITIYIKAIKFLTYGALNQLQLAFVSTRQFPVCVIMGVYFEGNNLDYPFGAQLSDGQFKIINSVFSNLYCGVNSNRGAITRIINCNDSGIAPRTGVTSYKSIIFYDISMNQINGSTSDIQSSYGTVYTS